MLLLLPAESKYMNTEQCYFIITDFAVTEDFVANSPIFELFPDAVSKPTILNHDFNFSTGGCQSSVNCSADGSWATYDCDQSICTQTHVSLTSINITVTVLDSRDVQCLANNHVSTNKSTITIMCKHQFHF